MTRVVFVHGIGGTRVPDQELDAWTEAVVVGARAAGADPSMLLGDPRVSRVFCHYADLFERPGVQGYGDVIDDDSAPLMLELIDDVIDHAISRTTTPNDVAILQRVRAEIHADGALQGPGRPVRILINAVTSLMELAPLRAAGRWTVSRLLVRDLAQVARYFNRGEFDGCRTLDERIRHRLRAELVGDPLVVVAHSLGSVVAFEALHEVDMEVALFVTLGSPLGLRTVVRPRLRPQPMATPDSVVRWLNFWDPDDLIVARVLDSADVLANVRGVQPASRLIRSHGLWTHGVRKYLENPEVAGAILGAVDQLAQRS